MFGVEPEHPVERGDGVIQPPVFDQGPSQEHQRVEGVGLGQQQVHQEADGLGGESGAAKQIGEGEPCVEKGREQLQGAVVGGSRRGRMVELLLDEPLLVPGLHQGGVELQRAGERVECASAVGELAEHAPAKQQQVGAPRRKRHRRVDILARAIEIADELPGAGPHHQRVGGLGRQTRDPLRRPQRLRSAAQRHQRAGLAEEDLGIVGVERGGLAKAVQRLAEETALRENLAEQRGAARSRGTAAQGAVHLGDRGVEEPLAEQVTREGEGIFARTRRRRSRLLGDQLSEQIVEQLRIEREALAGGLGAGRGRQGRRHRKQRLLELELDGEREVLRHVERIQLQRPTGLPQRVVEGADLAQGEAEIVARRRAVGIALDGAREGVAGVGMAMELHQHQPDSVPRRRIRGALRQHRPVRLQRGLELPPLQVQQREVEPRAGEVGPGPEGGVERVDRVAARLPRGGDAEVVPGQGVARIGVHRAAVAAPRLLPPARLMEADAALVPQLGVPGLPLEQPVVQIDRGAEILPEEVGLPHALERGRLVLAGLEGQPVFPEGFGQVAALPEGDREAQVGLQGGSGASPRRRSAGGPRRCGPPLPADQQIGLRGAQRRVERDGLAGRGAGGFVVAEVAVHESEDVVDLRVIGAQHARLGEDRERLVVEPAIVEHPAEVQAGHRAGGIHVAGALEPLGGDLEAAPGLLHDPELDQRGGVGGADAEQLLVLQRGLVVLAEGEVGAAQLEAHRAGAGLPGQPLVQLGDPGVVIARFALEGLQVVLGDPHLGIELQGPPERGDRFGDQPPLVIEDAKIVLRAGIGGIDAPGERAESVGVPAGRSGRRHGVSWRCESRRRWRSAKGGPASAETDR